MVEIIIQDGSNAQAIWDKLRQLVIAGRSVELVSRSRNGRRVIEVRRWTTVRADGSNRAEASPDETY